LEFVARILTAALERFEIRTATQILDAAERCPVLTDGELTALRDSATTTCTPVWWHRLAEHVGDDARVPLCALMLQVGMDTVAADRVLDCGGSIAIIALLNTAPAAPSSTALQHASEDPRNAEYAAALRVVLAARGAGTAESC
jgi:hypothetical protein